MNKMDFKLFILKSCPYCVEALKWMNELKAEDVRFADLSPEIIDEGEQPALADSFDYYYVPTFYLNGKKLHEGAATKEKIKTVLETAL